MTSGFLPLGPIVLAWFAACLVAARRVFVSPGLGTQAERGMLTGAAALIGLAPVIWFGLAWLAGETTPFAGGVQLGVAALLIGAAAWNRYRRGLPGGGVSGLHYNEKSALIVVAALLLVFGAFARRAWGAEDAVILVAFGRAIVEFVVLAIVGHTIAALTHRPISAVDAAPDERDREVTLKSSRNAYYLLFAGFVSLPFCAVFDPSVVSFVVTWTATLVLSELVYYGSVLAYYRLGTY